MTKDNNNWSEWKNLVLDKLDNQAEQHQDLQEQVLQIRTNDLPKIRSDIATLKTKAAIWGGGMAIILSAIVSLAIKFT